MAAKKVQIFQQLRDKITKEKGLLPAEKRAQFWMKNYTTQLMQWQRMHRGMSFDQLSREQFSKQFVTPRGAFPGCFYFYHYDPKWKKELPYYDTFPFVLVLSVEKNSFLGLNFHYLDYFRRAQFFDALYPFREGRTATPDVRDIRMRLLISYDILKTSSKYRAFRPCIKRYLMKHVQTPLMKVTAREWDVALFLPVESFVKRSRQHVWKESEKKIF